jgi:3-hydroxy-9,10-secoandrosta-1,3,5(10)-triene-9,17-dione monooxygenase reductase component
LEVASILVHPVVYDPVTSASPDPSRPASVAIQQAFKRMATNVAVITVADDDGIHGCTANAWGESCEPPVLLVTLRRGGTTQQRISRRGCFGVNQLADDQEQLARAIARRGDRFSGVSSRRGETLGQPLLDSALATLECRLAAQHPFGAYDILVGEVHDAGVRADAGPLLFFAGRFAAGPTASSS